MLLIDWLIVFGYLGTTIVLGLFLSKRNKNDNDYFVAGRRLSGWLAGASMAATTFSIDTPLYVAGLVGTRGVLGNWEWWSFGLAHVAMAVVFAPLWRRSGVLTDAAFTELRYGGAAAAWLRGVKAFLLAIPINCIGIGYSFLAIKKVIEALGIVHGVNFYGGITDTVCFLIVVAFLVLIYTVVGGLWAVVITDFLQLILAILGAFTLAVVVVNQAGGMTNLLDNIARLNRPELLSFFPWSVTYDGGFKWINGIGVSMSTFAAFLTLQWWSFRRSDGGGEFVQRMLATKNEREAQKAAWVFLVVNYLLRSWLWVIVALAALVLLPGQNDWESSYPLLAITYLPPIALGLVVVSLVAAFMSTVSTAVNWGASYLTHDLFQRFIRPSATQSELLFVGQITTIILLLLGVWTALISDSIGEVFRLVIAIGTGPGMVLVLRWFWWRINAAAELSAMVCGFVVGVTTSLYPNLRIEDYGLRLFATTAITGLVWILVMFSTPSESPEVLERFVRKVSPPGPGWKKLRQKHDVQPKETVDNLIFRFFLSSFVLFGFLLGIGAFLLHQQFIGWLSLVLGMGSLIILRKSSLHQKQLIG